MREINMIQVDDLAKTLENLKVKNKKLNIVNIEESP
jgi:hypothetical protein